jgi:hypothetical protein
MTFGARLFWEQTIIAGWMTMRTRNSIREGTEMNRAVEEKERSPESGNAYI